MHCTACGAKLHDLQIVCTNCRVRPVVKTDIPKPSQTVAKTDTPKPPQKLTPNYNVILGQQSAVIRLKAISDFCRSRATVAEHILLVGPDGMGKRTIARFFAQQLGVQTKELDAATTERVGDFIAGATTIEPGQILLIQNFDSLRSGIREILLTALQHYRIDLIIGKGSPGARIHPFQLNRFTCIATAEREADCPPELRELFAMAIPLAPYSQSELEALATLIAGKAGVSIDPGAARLTAGACGGIPHKLEILIHRLAKASVGGITEKNALEVLSMYGITTASGLPSAPTPEGGIQNLTGVQFEELITSLLARLGFRAQMTKASGDGGIDIVAVLNKPVVGGKCLFQCKRFASTTLVGSPVVREFYGAVSADRQVVKGVLITTSGFTEQARAFAQEVGIELIDMEQLGRLLTEQGMLGTTPQRVEPLLTAKLLQVESLAIEAKTLLDSLVEPVASEDQIENFLDKDPCGSARLQIQNDIMRLIIFMFACNGPVTEREALFFQPIYNKLQPKPILRNAGPLTIHFIEELATAWSWLTTPYTKPEALSLLETFDEKNGAQYSEKLRNFLVRLATAAASVDGPPSAKTTSELERIRAILQQQTTPRST